MSLTAEIKKVFPNATITSLPTAPKGDLILRVNNKEYFVNSKVSQRPDWATLVAEIAPMIKKDLGLTL